MTPQPAGLHALPAEANAPTTNAVDPAPPAKRPSFWVAFWAVAMVQMLLFCVSIVALNFTTQAINSKFATLAREQYLWDMVWINVDLLRGYALVGLGILLAAWPLVSWTLRKRVRCSRWSVFWRTSGFAFGVWIFSLLRFYHERPFYFSSLSEIQEGYEAVFCWLSPRGRDFLFYVVPWVVALLVLLHYLSALVSVVARKWSPSACRACGGVILAIVSVCGYLWQQRGLTGQAAVRTDPRPNILILASDSLRADHLSVNGYHRPTSPNIDALAARPGAVNFSKCFTPIASTLESCTSLMTGQYPHTHGLQHMFPNKTQVEHMQANSPTLAAQLQSSGYSARAMGDWCGAVYDLLHLGFKERDVSTYDNFQVYMTQAAYLTHAVLPLFFDNEVGHSLFPDLRSCAMLVTPEVVTQRLKRSLTSAAAEQKPFFIKAFYSTTHLPYTVDPPWSKKFTDPEYRGHNNGKVQFDLGAFIADVDSAAKLRETQDSEIQQIIGLYDGCVAKFDATVGEIVAHLEKTGLLRNTIVIVTSDHGDGLFEPGCSLGHGLTFNGGDQDTNIPAVFYIPGRNTPPQKVEQIIRTIDFAPTLLDYAGLPRDSRMDGISVRPLLEGKKLSKNPAYYGETSYLFCKRQIPNEEPLFIPAMEDTTFVDPSFSFHFVLKDAYQDKVLQTKERCVRTQDWKLVFTPGKYYDIWRLFHLPSDPRCQKPLQLLRPEVAAPMKKALLTWMREKREMSIGEIFPEGEPSPQGLSLR